MASPEPTVSVIIPTYNRAEFLGHAIHSVLSQTYCDFEMIIVDDGSNDNTRQIVDSFDDPRIHYIRHSENLGTPTALNTGIKAALGEYIAFLGDDDEWSPNLLAREVPVLQESEQIGVVHSSCWRFNRGKAKKFRFPRAPVPETREQFHKRTLDARPSSHSGALVRKDLLCAVGGYDERLLKAQDSDLWIRLSKLCEFAFVDEPLVSVCPIRHKGFDRQAAIQRIDSVEILLEKHWHDLGQSRPTLARLLSILGILHLRVGNMKEGRSYLFKSLWVRPFQRHNALLNLLASFFGVRGYDLLRRIWSYFRW